MKLELVRTYFPEGANGEILFEGRLMMYTIELPWKNNQAGVSCIPEGECELAKRWSVKFGRHLQILNVPGRKYILIHPANEALRELKGCISFIAILSNTHRSHSKPSHWTDPASPSLIRTLPAIIIAISFLPINFAYARFNF